MNMPMDSLHSSYDLTLVTLSYLVAALASYTALDLSGRVTAVRGSGSLLWLSGSAMAMGGGIWSMHFVAMLAFHIGMPVSYDLPIVLLSAVFAIVGAGVALAAVSLGGFSTWRLLFGGLFMGTGVVAMHYTGMAAMRMAATVSYDMGLFLASVGIAVGASLAALWLTFRFRDFGGRSQVFPKLLAALVMGAAVAGMHYTGMAAAKFMPTNEGVTEGVPVGPLAYSIVVATSLYLGMILLGAFIDRRMRFQSERLLASEQRFQSLFAHNADPVIAVDLDGRVVDANSATLKNTRLDLEVMRGKTFTELGILSDPISVRQAFENTLIEGPQSFETKLVIEGTESSFTVTMIPIMVGKTAYGVYAMGKDITEQKRAEERIRFMAYHDDLTGLANRRLLLEELVSRLTQSRKFVSLLTFDLDRFKAINNAIGQDSGDQVLREFANRLGEIDSALAARVGSDEFAVLFTADSYKEATARAEMVFHGLDRDIRWDDHELQLQASAGCAVYPTDGADVDSLVKNAEIALFWAKRRGRNQLLLFDKEMLLRAQMRLEIEEGLRKALDRNEFEVRYQVQKSMSGETVGTEALLRWHPTGGSPVSPGDFIPVAEDSGLINVIGTWVLKTACQQNKAWQDAGLEPIVMSVNLSIKQFEQPDFVSTVAAVLAETGLSPRYLDLEITESMAMEVEQTLATLSGLKALGVHISMDDFGTGYSSLSSLKRFPIDSLKIDQSFVRDIAHGEEAPIVETVIAVAHTFKLRVVAEGVENEAQLEFLKTKGCDVVQGYFYGRPQTPEDFRSDHLRSAS